MVSSPIRVLLVEDHDMVAEAMGLAFAAVTDIDIVARGRSLSDAFELTPRIRPDVIVLDRRLPDGDGVSAIGRLRLLHPAARVLVLTGDANAAVVTRVVEAGGAGLMQKSARLNDLANAVRRVAAGQAVFGDDLLPMRPLNSPLTRREHQMLVLMADGANTGEIAERLHVARNTVRNHVQSVLTKLEAHSQLEAVAIARRAGLLD